MVLPATIAAVAAIWQNSQRKKDKEEQRKREERNSAKLSIENMITQDIIRVELLGKMPENRDNIELEYRRYHDNGGNDIITRQVKEYEAWIGQFKPKKANL